VGVQDVSGGRETSQPDQSPQISAGTRPIATGASGSRVKRPVSSSNSQVSRP
jgi:hypothetical protein